MPLQSLAKLLLLGGACLLLLGALLWVGARFFPSGVPGDIAFRRGHTAFYFPVVSSLVLSLLATVVLNIVLRFFR